MSYLAEQYAGFITKDMILSLFEKLKRHLGDNMAKTAEACDLTRKTAYDLEKSMDIRLSTKEKVLEQLLEQIPLPTLEYLTKQMHDASSDSLMSYLSTIYEKAFDTHDKDEFLKLSNEFEFATKNFAGLVYKKLDFEVSDMLHGLQEWASQNNIDWKPKEFHLYDSETIKKVVPEIINMWIYSSFPMSKEELANRNKVPLGLIDVVGNTLNQTFFPYYGGEEESEELVNPRTEGTEVGFYITRGHKTMLGSTASIPTQQKNIARYKNNPRKVQ